MQRPEYGFRAGVKSVGRVRWRESMLALRALGVDTTVELGGNKVLTGMVKRIDKELQTVTLDTPAEIEAFARGL